MLHSIQPSLRNRLLALLCAVAVLGLALAVPPALQACPSQQVEYTYYTDGTYTTPCGYKIIPCSCGGGAISSGCRTSYYTIDWSEC
jgi:hypothetical protein